MIETYKTGNDMGKINMNQLFTCLPVQELGFMK